MTIFGVLLHFVFKLNPDSSFVPHIDFAIDKGLIKAFHSHQLDVILVNIRYVYNRNRPILEE